MSGKNYWTEENIPKIKKIWKECIYQKYQITEAHQIFIERGFPVSESTIERWKINLALTRKKQSGLTAKINKHFPNQELGDIEGEVFVPLEFRGIKCEGYTHSSKGNVIGKRNHKLLWGKRNGYPIVVLSIKDEAFTDEHYLPVEIAESIRKGYKPKSRLKTIGVHQLVAETFLPKPIPSCFCDIWYTLTDEQKLWTQKVYEIDHINDDKSNPDISNLQWILREDNNSDNKIKTKGKKE